MYIIRVTNTIQNRIKIIIIIYQSRRAYLIHHNKFVIIILQSHVYAL